MPEWDFCAAELSKLLRKNVDTVRDESWTGYAWLTEVVRFYNRRQDVRI